jgi:hypothetical protein
MTNIKSKITKLWGKLNAMFLLLFATLPQYCLNAYASYGAKTDTNFMGYFLQLTAEYQTEITAVLGISMILSIAIFVYHCVQLNAHANNPAARKNDINNLLITGFCLAAQGSVTAILAVIFYMFG